MKRERANERLVRDFIEHGRVAKVEVEREIVRGREIVARKGRGDVRRGVGRVFEKLVVGRTDNVPLSAFREHPDRHVEQHGRIAAVDRLGASCGPLFPGIPRRHDAPIKLLTNRADLIHLVHLIHQDQPRQKRMTIRLEPVLPQKSPYARVALGIGDPRGEIHQVIDMRQEHLAVMRITGLARVSSLQLREATPCRVERGFGVGEVDGTDGAELEVACGPGEFAGRGGAVLDVEVGVERAVEDVFGVPDKVL